MLADSVFAIQQESALLTLESQYTLQDSKAVSSRHSHSSSKLISRREPQRYGTHSDGKIRRRSSSTRLPAKSEEKTIKGTIVEGKHTDMAANERSPRATKEEEISELSPLMTSLVEEELKQVMISFWSSLPEEAPSKAQKQVLDTYNNSAGDDLRNAIGLSVTKRLLNLNNGILVKVRPLASVSRADLSLFAMKYRIFELKFVAQRTYAGRMRNWADLDYVVKARNLKCGTAPVAVSPVYHFLKCPSTLQTKFDGQQDFTREKEEELKSARDKKRLNDCLKIIKTAAEEETKVMESSSKDKQDKYRKAKSEKEAENKDNVENDKVLHKKPVTKNTDKKDSTPNAMVEPPNTVLRSAADSDKMKVTTPRPNEVKKSILSAKGKPTNQTITSSKISPNTKVTKPKTEQNYSTKEHTAINNQSNNTATIEESSKPNETMKTDVKASNLESTKTATEVMKSETKIVTAQKVEPVKPVTAQAVLAKTAPVKTVTSKVITADVVLSKIEPAKIVTAQAVLAKKEPAKIVTAQAVLAKKEPAKIVTAKEKTADAILAKKEPAKVITAQTVLAKAPAKSDMAKPSPTQSVVKTEPTKRKEKTLPAKKVLTKSMPVTNKSLVIEEKASKNNDNDFEELDDRDILALLSGGIILDECSGSDE